MLYKIVRHRISLGAAMLVIGLLTLLSTLFAGSTPSLASSTQQNPVQTNIASFSQPQSAPPLADPSLPASAANFTCNAGTYIYAVDVTWTSLGCDNGPVTNPTWFAISSSDPKAALFLSAYTTGFVMDKGLFVVYDNDPTLVNGLCAPSNCRKIYTVYVLK